jgi:uncharacterized protein (DUF58 family)
MPRHDSPIDNEAVMAQRTYRVEGPRGTRALRLALAFPTLAADGSYECRAEIADEDERIVRPMRGRDALEALMLALINISAELHLFTDLAIDRFTWLDGKETGLRFPSLPDYSLRCVMEH